MLLLRELNIITEIFPSFMKKTPIQIVIACKLYTFETFCEGSRAKLGHIVRVGVVTGSCHDRETSTIGVLYWHKEKYSLSSENSRLPTLCLLCPCGVNGPFQRGIDKVNRFWKWGSFITYWHWFIYFAFSKKIFWNVSRAPPWHLPTYRYLVIIIIYLT